MGFRRSKEAGRLSKSWRDFREANASVLQASGVPISLYESRDLFDDLLMHGCVDNRLDPTRYLVDQLSAKQREAFVELVVRYLRAGFPDPGIVGFLGGPSREEILRRLGQVPGTDSNWADDR